MYTILKADAIIDGTGVVPLTHTAVVVKDGRIVDLVSTDSILSIADAEVVDLAGTTLLPGLIDGHTHLSMTPRLHDYGGKMRDPLPILVARATRNLREDLLSGVTTTRVLGDKDLLDIELSKSVDDGTIPGPQVIPSGKGLRSTNGHGAAGTIADGVDAVLRQVRENLHAGARVIKLFIGGDPKEDNITDCCYSPQEIQAAVQESLRANVRVATHCMGGDGVRYFVEAAGEMGVVEHGGFLTCEDMDLMLERGAWLGFTCNSMFRPERLNNLRSPELTAKVNVIRDQVIQNYRDALDAGLRISLGTDAQHGEMAYELEFLVDELDVSPLDAIRIATHDNAMAYGLDGDRGVIQPGKRADIIAAAGDPASDIHALRSITYVMKEGMVQSGLSAM